MFSKLKRNAVVLVAAVSITAGVANADLGLGANLGEPTALDIRVGQQKTLEGMLGWSLRQGGQSRVILVGNILFHGASLGRESPITGIYPYAGVGLGFWSDGNQGAWIQVPLGLDFRFTVPVEIGFHVDPGMDIVPNTGFTVHWGLGVRYWFK